MSFEALSQRKGQKSAETAKITDREVQFWAKDKIRKRRVNVSCTPEEFVAAVAEDVPDRHPAVSWQ
jgi:hypothetical protein